MGKQLLFAAALVVTVLLSMCLTPETNFFMSSPPKILTPLGTQSPSPTFATTIEPTPTIAPSLTGTPATTATPTTRMTVTDAGRIGASDFTSMLSSAVYDGKLYIGTGNPTAGGRVYRYDGSSTWTDTGTLGTGRYVYSLAVYNGNLYGGTSLGRVFRYDGVTGWTDVGRLGSDAPVHSLTVYEEKLYGGTASGKVYRHDGDAVWSDAGQLVSDTRVSSLADYDGKLYGGIGPFGKVYRYDGYGTVWTEVGQLDGEVEVSSLAVYGGKLYGRGYNSGKVYRYDGGTAWTEIGPLLPDSRLRYITIYDGKLYGGGSGRVYSDDVPDIAGTMKGTVYRYDGGTGWTEVATLQAGGGVTFLAAYDGKLYAAIENSNEMYSIGK